MFRTIGRISASTALAVTTIALVPALTLLVNAHCEKLCTEIDASYLYSSIFFALNVVTGFINIIIVVMCVTIATAEATLLQAKILQMLHTITVIVLHFIAALLAKKVKDFPVRCFNKPNWFNFIIQSLITWNFCVFAQFIIYHSFFIALAMLCHPIGVACMTTIYVIGTFCLVSIISLILLTIILAIKLLRRHKNTKHIRSAIIRIIKGIMFGSAVLGIATLLAIFSLVGENISEHKGIKITHPVVGTLLLAAAGWLSNNVVKKFWLQKKKLSKENISQDSIMQILDRQYEETFFTTSYVNYEYNRSTQ